MGCLRERRLGKVDFEKVSRRVGFRIGLGLFWA